MILVDSDYVVVESNWRELGKIETRCRTKERWSTVVCDESFNVFGNFLISEKKKFFLYFFIFWSRARY